MELPTFEPIQDPTKPHKPSNSSNSKLMRPLGNKFVKYTSSNANGSNSNSNNSSNKIPHTSSNCLPDLTFNDFQFNDYSLNFEAIDLCMPLNSAHILNEQIAQQQQQLQSSNLKYMNANHNKNDAQRSNSVPLCTLNDFNDSFFFNTLSTSSDLIVTNANNHTDQFINDGLTNHEQQSQEPDVDKNKNVNSSKPSLVECVNVNNDENSNRDNTASSRGSTPRKKASKKPKISKVERQAKVADIYGFDLKLIVQNYCIGVYSCFFKSCGLEFSDQSGILEHIKEKHQINDENAELNKSIKFSFKCTYDSCSKMQESYNKMAHHICKTHLVNIPNSLELIKQVNQNFTHYENTNNKNGNSSAPAQAATNQPKNYFHLFKCSYENCLWSFQTESQLKLHKLKHKALELQLEESLNKQHNENEPGESNEENLLKKLLIFSKKYLCNICNTRFSRPSHYKSHMQLHESNEPKIKCDYCTETFLKQSLLIAHVSQTHKNDNVVKLFKCSMDDCNSEFLTKMNLENHVVKAHSHEADKVCSKCNKKFQAVWLRNQHEEIVHNGSSIYKCFFQDCNKTFSSSSKLQRHNKIHFKIKNFKCDICNADFNRREHLNSHKNFHSTVKLYKCDFMNCRSKFKYNENLIAHRKLHLTKSEEPLKLVDEDLIQTEAMNKLEFTQINNLSSDLNSLNSTGCSSGCSSVSNSILSNNETYELESYPKLNLFSCDHCEFKTDIEESLQTHFQTHLEIKKPDDKLDDYIIDITTEQTSINDQSKEEATSKAHDTTNVEEAAQNYYEHHLQESSNTIIVNSEPSDFSQVNSDEYETGKNQTIIFRAQHSEPHLDNEYFTTHDNNSNTDFIQISDSPTPKMASSKQEHIININSDDEEYATCCVVLENLSGSARTDYKSNHAYIEKYKAKSKRKKKFNDRFGKKFKLSNDHTNELILERSKSVSPISTTSTSLLESSPPGSVKEKSHQSPNSKRKSNKKKKDQHEKFSAQLSDQLNSINLINIKNLLQTQLLQDDSSNPRELMD